MAVTDDGEAALQIFQDYGDMITDYVITVTVHLIRLLRAVTMATCYTASAGFVGEDSFTYARKGLDPRNSPVAMIVRVAVRVLP